MFKILQIFIICFTSLYKGELLITLFLAVTSVLLNTCLTEYNIIVRVIIIIYYFVDNEYEYEYECLPQKNGYVLRYDLSKKVVVFQLHK